MVRDLATCDSCPECLTALVDDWDYIADRTRNLRALAHWETPGSVIDSAAFGYRTDRWANQSHYVEVWIEKDALVGVITKARKRLDVACAFDTYTSEAAPKSEWCRSQILAGRDLALPELVGASGPVHELAGELLCLLRGNSGLRHDVETARLCGDHPLARPVGQGHQL